ncbi:hypothetical protein [Polaribacter sp. 11A2H]|uniref:hypothetical protein n=1 Tax=Polaribacter sp. 11A2H TaxID=2687290 RepID=UPI0014082936|nr:hypothetical protein [Polaribacter sp. 11A2H]
MKTVYILGAGFSVEAGAPIQLKILQEAFRLHKLNPSDFEEQRFSIFINFLKEQLNFTENNFSHIELEDIFTPLDRCLADSSQFRGISLGKIMEVRESVFYVIGRTIQLVLNQTNKSKNYINQFARHLTKISSQRTNHNYGNIDPVSVISTNWDILLDNSIQRAILDGEHNAVVDYCCYISSRDELDHSIKPGLEKLGQGGFNVKLLKLHGSLNWLQCPRCARLYARFSRKDGIRNHIDNESCRHCDTNFPEEENNHKLTSNLIMPTYAKDLSNPQYKIIWQNAGIEISEAEKLVFIGYSLPSADFEMRQLLSRMVRKNVKIEVVGYSDNDNQQKITKEHWSKFFGDRDLSFHFDGAKSYVESIVEN